MDLVRDVNGLAGFVGYCGLLGGWVFAGGLGEWDGMGWLVVSGRGRG